MAHSKLTGSKDESPNLPGRLQASFLSAEYSLFLPLVLNKKHYALKTIWHTLITTMNTHKSGTYHNNDMHTKTNTPSTMQKAIETQKYVKRGRSTH